MRPLRSVARLVLVCCLSLLGASAAQPDLSPLLPFLPDEESINRLKPTIDRLESESYAEREEASRQLAALPALPSFIRELATTETRAESSFRLRKLAASFPIEKENDRLTSILRQLAQDKTKGQLEPIMRVIATGVWSPAEPALHQAARATVTQADVPLLERHLSDPSATIRRLIAAALGGLPAADSTAMLAGLLNDSDAATAVLAATELAARRDPRALATFARLLMAPSFQIRHQCHLALRGLSNRDFGYDPGAETTERAAPAAQWRQWANSKDAAITGTVPEDSSIVLFNGQDLEGWEVRVGDELMDKADAWEAVAGELHCKGKLMVASGDLWTKARYEDFILNLEYKADAKDCDSGIGLLLTKAGEQGQGAPKYLEVQLLPDNGGDLYQIGGVAVEAKGKPIAFQCPRLAAVEDRAGAWHRLKLIVRNGTVTVEINGVVVNRTSKGPQGPGRIVLRNEGSAVSFRNLVLQPLDTPDAGGKPEAR